MAVLAHITAWMIVLGTVLGDYPYYGKLIQQGWGSQATNALAGSIYAVNENTIQIIGFTYTATPAETDTAIVLASSDTFSEVDILATPASPLRSYDNEKLMFSLPDGKKISDYTKIGVANTQTETYYGQAPIPSGFEAPAPQAIGTFKGTAHKVASGTVTVIDDRTIEVLNFEYDGQGPDAFWYVGITDAVNKQDKPYGVIPDENGISDTKAKAYSNDYVILTLPQTISATDLKWLSMYCVRYAHNFGEVRFPAEGTLNVPPYTGEVSIDRAGFSCEPLSDKLQVAWLITGDTISIELAGNIDRDTDYMAFGISGSQTGFLMTDADVVVTDFREGEEARAIDYFLTDYSQCADNGGACPDTSSYNSGQDDVTLLAAQITSGITRIKYSRPLVTSDPKDHPFFANGTKQQIVWGIGPLNTKDEAAKHYVNDRSSEAVEFDFNRTVVDNCPSIKVAAEVKPPDFKEHHLYGKEGREVFTVEIGQAGSEQGYKAITGLPSWGIAWYVNGILIPELHLKRGVSYTFRVGGGTEASEGSMYHPFYFTDDIKGGYDLSQRGTIYKGKVDGKEVDYATGGYCEWKLTSTAIKAIDNGHIWKCFEEFKENLYLDCTPGTGGYTDFVFTPDSSTPDTIYYQCYTHESLGWKVNVYDDLPVEELVTEGCDSGSVTVVSILLLLTCLLISSYA